MASISATVLLQERVFLFTTASKRPLGPERPNKSLYGLYIVTHSYFCTVLATGTPAVPCKRCEHWQASPTSSKPIYLWWTSSHSHSSTNHSFTLTVSPFLRGIRRRWDPVLIPGRATSPRPPGHGKGTEIQFGSGIASFVSSESKLILSLGHFLRPMLSRKSCSSAKHFESPAFAGLSPGFCRGFCRCLSLDLLTCQCLCLDLLTCNGSGQVVDCTPARLGWVAYHSWQNEETASGHRHEHDLGDSQVTQKTFHSIGLKETRLTEHVF